MRLKRKLKTQFLSQVDKINIKKEKMSIEKKLLKASVTFLLILLLLLWGVIPSIVLHILGIDVESLSDTVKVLISFINDMLFILLLIFMYFKTVKNDFIKYFNHNFFDNLKKTLFYWSLGLCCLVVSNYIITFVLNGQLSENEEAIRSMFQLHPFYMAFNIVIYAPITEELIFRKSIKDACNSKWGFILASGLIFGSLHVITSITDLTSLLHLLPYCSLGIAFSWLYHDSDNIFSTITAHFIHNTMALFVYLLTL